MMTASNKWMGIDFGLVRIGIAVSDPLGVLARGLKTLTWNGRDEPRVLDELTDLIQSEAVIGVVMGCPNRTDGRQSAMIDRIEAFAQTLRQRTGIPVLFRDERYTTVIAARKLHEQGLKARRQRHKIDQAAATVILQEHLDSCRKDQL